MWKTLKDRFQPKPADVAEAVAGAALFAAPWVFGFAALTAAAWNAWAVGAAILIVALAAIFKLSAYEEWANLGLGLWAAVAPWALGFAAVSVALWVHLALGLTVAALAARRLWTEIGPPASHA